MLDTAYEGNLPDDADGHLLRSGVDLRAFLQTLAADELRAL